MPDFKLPAPEQGKDDRETITMLLDTVARYRKELEFLLNNLDKSNMPEIANFMQDTTGNFSSIIQTTEAIALTVGNNTGDIAALNVTAGQIQTTVSSHTDSLATQQSSITQNAGDITLRVAKTNYNAETIASYLSLTATTAKIKAENINLEGITRVYASGDNARFMEMGTLRGGFRSVYNATTTFEIDNGIDYASLWMQGVRMLEMDATGKSRPKGTWDFTGVTVEGLTAKFG